MKFAPNHLYIEEYVKCTNCVHSVSGPALVEESASVTVLDPGKTMTVDRHGNLLLSN